MAKVSIVLDDHDWGVVLAHFRPVEIVSETVYRSILEQFNQHVQGRLVPMVRRDDPAHQHVLDAINEILSKAGDRNFAQSNRNYDLLDAIWSIAVSAKESLKKSTCGGGP